MAWIPNDSKVICYAIQLPNSAVKLDFFDIKQENNFYVCDQNSKMNYENGFWKHQKMDFGNTRTLCFDTHYHQLFLQVWLSTKDPDSGNDQIIKAHLNSRVHFNSCLDQGITKNGRCNYKTSVLGKWASYSIILLNI